MIRLIGIALLSAAGHGPTSERGAVTTFDLRHPRFTIELPAIDLPANVNYSDPGFVIYTEVTLPENMWLHGYRVETYNDKGERIGTSVLHHMTLIDPDHRELFSPVMLRFGAAGSETGEVLVKNWIGVPLNRGNRITVNALLMNPSAQPLPGTHLRVIFTATRRATNSDVLAVYPFHVHAGSGLEESPSFDLPAGYSTKTWEGRPAINGRLVGMGGHMHKYGVSLRFEDVTAEKVLFEAVADTDATGAITDMRRTDFNGKTVAISRNHVYRITAVYNNTSGQAIAAAGMGIIGGVVIPAKGSWPAADETDPILRYDRDRQPTETISLAQHHHHN